jgi:hypothetical protein
MPKDAELMVMDTPLYGDPDNGPIARRFRELERENAQLRDELEIARSEAEAGKRQARAVANLRKQLGPLYRALQMVFGEIEAVSSDEPTATASAPQAAPSDRVAKIWESWKARFPGKAAAIIDALLLQPGMNQSQLAIAVGCHRASVPDLVYKLNKAGLLRKEGNNYFLKNL